MGWLLLIGLCFSGVPADCSADSGKPTAGSLEEQLRSLRVGFDPYFIGQILNAEQQSAARKSLQPDAYAGTYKFQDKDLMVVVEEKSHMILAMYWLIDEAEPEEIKKAIIGLMDKFGQPTASGHDKVIYWIYGKNGKITDKQFNKAKKSGKIEEVVATVKFISSREFPEGAKGSQAKGKSSVYTLITSPALLSRLFKKNEPAQAQQ